ncbi:MAG: hypothetical protein WCH46_02730 [bacterium]
MNKDSPFFFLLCLTVLISCSKKQDDASGEVSAGYKVVQVTNGGSIHGRVTLNGALVGLEKIEIQKDQDVCGGTHTNPALPGASGGVANCIIGIEKITAGKDFEKRDHTFDQNHCDFSPHVQIIPLGSEILVSNSDKVIHNYHVNHNGETVLNEAQPEGVPPREIKLKSSGVHTVSCDVHPWMRGFIWIADNPYYSITDTSGSFSLENVPPGKYKLFLWRDNWNVEELKNGTGNIESYRWGKDINQEKEVVVEDSKISEINFIIP